MIAVSATDKRNQLHELKDQIAETEATGSDQNARGQNDMESMKRPCTSTTAIMRDREVGDERGGMKEKATSANERWRNVNETEQRRERSNVS